MYRKLALMRAYSSLHRCPLTHFCTNTTAMIFRSLMSSLCLACLRISSISCLRFDSKVCYLVSCLLLISSGSTRRGDVDAMRWLDLSGFCWMCCCCWGCWGGWPYYAPILCTWSSLYCTYYTYIILNYPCLDSRYFYYTTVSVFRKDYDASEST